jgi:hypothetical protein
MANDTTDFYDVTLAQATRYSSVLRSIGGASVLADRIDDLATLCSTAVSQGRKRADGAWISTQMAMLVTRYESLSAAKKLEFLNAERVAP